MHRTGAWIASRYIHREEAIRDLKNHRFGSELRYTRNKRPERLESLLLVVVHATLILWLLGPAATDRHWGRCVQANTDRRRPVLSTVFLGQELCRNHPYKVRFAELFEAPKRLTLLARLPQLTAETRVTR